MADRPQLPGVVAVALAEHAAGRISAEVALMRMVLAGSPAAELPDLLRDHPALAIAARERAAGLTTLERLREAGALHDGSTTPEETRAMFDRLAAISPEGSVAAYSLADPATLAAATAELLAWLRGCGLLEERPRVLDLGCGIGRVAAAVAPDATDVLGLDISQAMLDAAQARHGDIANLRFAACSGRDLAGLADDGFDLVLAIDVFPYLLQAGTGLARTMLAEIARVLRSGGQLALVNLSYAGEAPDLAGLAAGAGLVVAEPPHHPFALWDGAAARLLRPGLAASARL